MAVSASASLEFVGLSTVVWRVRHEKSAPLIVEESVRRDFSQGDHVRLHVDTRGLLVL